METVKSILLGICYGFCAIMLMKGGFVKPLLLSQGLGITVAGLSVRKVMLNMPKIWFAAGFIVGGIVTWFVELF
ncbi:MAG: hypothetical protein M0R40_06890 [Firmicutes bacterium]|nr:hypothetical protein [Bacillota bacterium]